ncbi:transmembrane protein 104 homolog isoform X1 [Nasonia vitripennis]|uniref:Amino acid transporter transmembrane domain-containing protein n=1 Tax=Nasonia vitripennis TaxID=7425 RepID=A0A7M7G4G8_NASVI|nr:transmembrane protein 104 homolog isoform X1 [Nasonia vitripennis]
MPEISSGEQYSTWVGLVYVFNLIVGTGALALPAVFSRAGWLLGSGVVLILAFISFITVTFVIEAIASANAIMTWRKIQQRKRVGLIQDSAFTGPELEAMQAIGESGLSNSDSEDTPLVTPAPRSPERAGSTYRYYVITEKIEMGEMASIFFSKMGVTLFYICLAVYLYGDLSIYGTAIAKSVTDVACTYLPVNYTCNETIPDSELCWQSYGLNRMDAYRLFLTLFVMFLGPFAFFNVQKTKYLQLLTSAMRWMAFMIMIIYAIRKLIVDGPEGKPRESNFSELPGLFGVCVYSFMCHHSLPALVAPISDKSKLNKSLSFDFILISFFYLLLALTGAFAFEQLDDLYTLDFGPRNCSYGENFFIVIIQYFLALFPVFTLSTSFPIIAITLRNNLQSLFLKEGETYNLCLRKLLFPVMAVFPPYLIAMSTKNLSVLVSITGSYAGTGIQYLIPIFLVYNARKQTAEIIGQGVINKFASPFASTRWIIFIFVWAVVCMMLVSLNFIKKHLSASLENFW